MRIIKQTGEYILVKSELAGEVMKFSHEVQEPGSQTYCDSWVNECCTDCHEPVTSDEVRPGDVGWELRVLRLCSICTRRLLNNERREKPAHA